MSTVSNQSNIRSSITNKAKVVMFLLFSLGILAIGRILILQTYSRKKWEARLTKTKSERSTRPIYAIRGNILANDGSLLATSVPYYNLGFDPSVADSTYFYKNIDGLCLDLEATLGERPAGEYKYLILKERKAFEAATKSIKKILQQIAKLDADDDDERTRIKDLRAKIEDLEHSYDRFISISKNDINHRKLLKISEFKFSWKNEKYARRGLVSVEKIVREHPFGQLARRALGSDDSTGNFGIEELYSKELSGQNGTGMRKRIGPKVWVPVEGKPFQVPVNGSDVFTTLDMNFQDVVEDELNQKLKEVKAEGGCAVVMEIATGNVKAMANLKYNPKNDTYNESINYAVQAGRGDPGSTIKLASLITLFEKNGVQLSDYVADCKGSLRIGNRDFTCSHAHGPVNVQQVFELSCNVGTYTIVKKFYGENPTTFINFLKDNLKLEQPALPESFAKEPTGNIKTPRSSDWSSISLSRISIGYEVELTPIQMLSFYNMIANNGKFVKPRLVTQVVDPLGEQVYRFDVKVNKEATISQAAIDKAKAMMVAVVKTGTAKNLETGNCPIAGKTGTAWSLINNVYNPNIQTVSFIGYFPADKPKYSCIVWMKGVTQNANTASAPVFKNIAERAYVFDISMQGSMALLPKPKNVANHAEVGFAADYQQVGKKISISVPNGTKVVKVKNDQSWQIVKVSNANKMPDVRGMTLKDALFTLENQGFRVSFNGRGKVEQQSIEPNTTLIKNKAVHLILGLK